MRRPVPRLSARTLLVASLLTALVTVLAGAALATIDDTPTLQAGAKPLKISEEDEQLLLQRDLFFMSRRTAGDVQLDNQEAGALRAAVALAEWRRGGGVHR